MSQANEQSVATIAKKGKISPIQQILAENPFPSNPKSRRLLIKGIYVFAYLLQKHNYFPDKIDVVTIDYLIAKIDRKLTAQLNEILHSEPFQKLESAWRSLRFVVDNIDFRENIRLEVLNVSKEDLVFDFEDSPQITKSGLYKIVYSNEYGVFGGKPYGVVCANYEFGPGAQDMQLLSQCAAISVMAHAPFIANASPEFFGESFDRLPHLRDLKSLFEGPQYMRWHAFRESEDSRNIGLCLPRFLLRLPYNEVSAPVKDFNFNEDVVGHRNRYLWGYASHAFVTRVADSFAKYRWCLHIIGSQAGGSVKNMTVQQYASMKPIQNKIPTEILITERREFELSEEGFISLTHRKDGDGACFFSANSVQKPKRFGNSVKAKQLEINYRLGTQLPYIFMMSRLAHYLKVLQREQIGTWKERADLERELNNWIRQYVADMDNPEPRVRSVRPLRQAQIIVENVEGQPGWYRCHLRVRPHFKYMGASFTLSLVGKLDRE